MPQEKKGISVVIPNYNGEYLLPEIFPTLFIALKNSNLPYEIIMSDDCSTDNSVIFVLQNFPEVIVLKNDINKGFSNTINKGIFLAQYSYLLLLNSDVKLTENYFKTLFPYFEMEETFGVMGRIVGWESDAIQDGAKYPSFHGTKIKTNGNYIPIHPQVNEKLFSMYLSGANALVSRQKILKLGGFNELFSPFYVEDFELSLRAWRLGWKCYYDHKSICKHKTSTTIKNNSHKNYIKKIYNRNKMILHAIHLPKNKLWLWQFQLFGETIFQTLLGKFWFAASVKMYLSNLKNVSASRKKFEKLGQAEGQMISVKDVIQKILNEISKIEVKKF